MSEMISGEVPIRNETKSGLPVESGANKTKSTGKRNRSWWQDAKAGSKGNPRRLQAHGNGKMVGVVGAEATVEVKSWATRSTATQQSKNYWFSRQSAILCISIKNTKGSNFGAMVGSDDKGLCTVPVCFPRWKQNPTNKDEVRSDFHKLIKIPPRATCLEQDPAQIFEYVKDDV